MILFFVLFSILYFLEHHRFFNAKLNQIILLCASLLFYSFSHIGFIPFLFYAFLITYCSSFLVRKNKFYFITAIVLDVLPLFAFKYINFLFPVTSSYIDYIYDEHLFYDAFAHLTTEGAKIRTQQLCNDLEKIFFEIIIKHKKASSQGRGFFPSNCRKT